MYGLLVVEDGNGLYQPLGEVASREEALEMARHYEAVASPENDDAAVPPNRYVIWRRNVRGAYTKREVYTL